MFDIIKVQIKQDTAKSSNYMLLINTKLVQEKHSDILSNLMNYVSGMFFFQLPVFLLK